MVEKLLHTITRKPSANTYVKSSKAIKKAINASMKDQRKLMEQAEKLQSAR